MEVMKLLEFLQETIENSSKMPITGKVLVDKKEIMEIIDQITNYLPDELKKAQWVMNEKERILAEAIKDSDGLRRESMDMVKKQIENHDITKEAKMRAEQIIALAQRDAKAMRLGARDYADEILCELEREINAKTSTMLVSVKKDVEEFMSDFNTKVTSTSETIRTNIKELRNVK